MIEYSNENEGFYIFWLFIHIFPYGMSSVSTLIYDKTVFLLPSWGFLCSIHKALEQEVEAGAKKKTQTMFDVNNLYVIVYSSDFRS